jgi:hypothetical protein
MAEMEKRAARGAGMKRLIAVIVTFASLALVACDAQEMSAQE